MKYLTYVFIFCFLISFLSTYAQEVAPLQLGNYWIYDSDPSNEILGKITVVDTNIVIDSISYFRLEGSSNYDTTKAYMYSRLNEDGYYVTRLDTSYPAPNHEKLYWKKNANLGDTWENPTTTFPLVYTILDTFVAPVFGNNITVKYLEIDGSLVLFNEYWTEEFGKMSSSDFGGLILLLQGCVIDGVAYGDTSFKIVSVENEFRQKESFVLQQNYPNPFNPATTIQFELRSGGIISLIIYDLLGNEVIRLIDKIYYPSGKFEKIWSGTDNYKNILSTGVYFYRLLIDNQSITKSMILIK
jgi:hypothetical protein